MCTGLACQQQYNITVGKCYMHEIKKSIKSWHFIVDETGPDLMLTIKDLYSGEKDI